MLVSKYCDLVIGPDAEAKRLLLALLAYYAISIMDFSRAASYAIPAASAEERGPIRGE